MSEMLPGFDRVEVIEGEIVEAEEGTQIVPWLGGVVSTGSTTGTGGGARSTMDLMVEWGKAFERWLHTGKRRSENTRASYRQAWKDFYEFTGNKFPWMVGSADVYAWVEALYNRGLAENTVGLRLAAISSFYQFCMTKYVFTARDGTDVPLHQGVNPAQVVERPKVIPYGKAVRLAPDESRALLRAIPRNTVGGLRDYALILFYLSTGRRNSEVRKLKKTQFRKNGEAWEYRWVGKGSERWDEAPAQAMRALMKYLKEAGRPWDELDDEAYLFTALSDMAGRLPNVDAESYDRYARPLSSRYVGQLVKRYARLAGLKAEKIKVHSLRHTFTRTIREAGADVEVTSDQLGHASIATTQIYLGKTESRKNEYWERMAALYGLEE